MVKRTATTQPPNLTNLQAQFEKNALDKIILRPVGADEQCGVQDPRITVDKRTGTYIMAYTAYGDASVPPKVCNASACGPTWEQCQHCCNHVMTKVVTSKTPEVEGSWARVARTGDRGFDGKSTAILVRDTPPHYMYVGAGSPVKSFQSDDLLHWTDPQVVLAGQYSPPFTTFVCQKKNFACTRTIVIRCAYDAQQ